MNRAHPATDDDLDPLPDDPAELCMLARNNGPLLRVMATRPGVPPDLAFACRAGARMLAALEVALRRATPDARHGKMPVEPAEADDAPAGPGRGR